ncbi:uncharacterized protein LOC103316306 isoform X3 [Nasonia vitripennis]|uniref:C2H2-type domain-containing protein n=1 Tax=Nasonia vitripennis TaxID=7425 RepID=A0A7M7IRM3_NASVI|nr:uncharacterized protein LOC103316306 isoform X3 [Nasonia vitripennis]
MGIRLNNGTYIGPACQRINNHLQRIRFPKQCRLRMLFRDSNLAIVSLYLKEDRAPFESDDETFELQLSDTSDIEELIENSPKKSKSLDPLQENKICNFFPNVYQCNICSYKTMYKRIFVRHIKAKHRSKSKNLLNDRKL